MRRASENVELGRESAVMRCSQERPCCHAGEIAFGPVQGAMNAATFGRFVRVCTSILAYANACPRCGCFIPSTMHVGAGFASRQMAGNGRGLHRALSLRCAAADL